MTFHMLRIGHDPAGFSAWAARQRLLRPGVDPGYAWHAILRAAFADAAPKPFRPIEPSGGAPYLLAYSDHDAAALRERAATLAEPAVAAVLDLAAMVSKPMPEAFPNGARFEVELRVRPVLRVDRDGDRRRTRERDAFLVAIEKAPGDRRIDREAIYRDWLAGRLDNAGAAVKPSNLRVLAQRRSRALRRNGDRTLIAAEGPDVIMSGGVTVREPARFADAVRRGIGRHRAFGFGMMLLRPPPAG